MEFLSLLTESRTQAFLLLILRFGGIFAFFPFFDSNLIPVSLRGALAFFMSLLFFSTLPSASLNLGLTDFLLAGIFELLFGFLASFALQIVFATLSFAGDNISFSMGLTIASAYDPATGSQKPIVGLILAMLAILFSLQLDFHHAIFSFIAETLKTIPLGHFSPNENIFEMMIKNFSSLFSIGFAMAFPILGMILLTDIIFGMIMKNHPQFNLFAIGFPVKIALALIIIVLVIPSLMQQFQAHLKENLYFLNQIF